jgi:hypothetical protein
VCGATECCRRVLAGGLGQGGERERSASTLVKLRERNGEEEG